MLPRAIEELRARRGRDGRWRSEGRLQLRAAYVRECEAHARGLRQRFRTQWCAKQIGITARHFRKLLRGERQPSLDLAVTIEIVFGVEAGLWGRRPLSTALRGPIRFDETLAR